MYSLMNKDNQVAVFNKAKDPLDNDFVMVSEEKDKLPIGFRDINSWLDNRQTAKHRKHLRQLMA